jgi:2,5-diketo-D-gluconate reductase A
MPRPPAYCVTIQDDTQDSGNIRGRERKVQSMTAPTRLLNDGNTIPQIGLGTWPLKDLEVAPVIVAAVQAGYRHIDTAARYGNERGVGQGIRDSGIRREDLFVTTKLDGSYQGNDRAIGGLNESLQRLGLDYIDLLLIHWPLPQRDEYMSTWKTFEKLVAAGKARSIGVSNFKPAHIDRLLAEARIRPAVNQIQLNPRITRPEQRAYNSAEGIVTVAWGPLAPGTDLLEHSTVISLGAKYAKTPGQIVLRWHIELGLVAIPKSANPARIAQNIDIFDFALTGDGVAELSALDTGADSGVDSDMMGH